MADNAVTLAVTSEVRSAVRGRRRAAVFATTLALLGGCASGVDPTGATAVRSSVSNTVAHGLSLWKGFPATASPRPLVITGPLIIDPFNGFPSTGDTIAYSDGRVALRTTLPGQPAAPPPLPLITAAQALTLLRGGRSGPPAGGSSLVVTRIRLGTSVFSTDRGQRRLPAWVISFAGVRDPASVLAVAPANRWPTEPSVSNHSPYLEAKIAPGGRSVTVIFIGAAAGSGPCTEKYAADVTQSSSAVAISIRRVPNSQDPAQACDVFGYERTVTVRLTPSLGGRVLVDPNGAPIAAR